MSVYRSYTLTIQIQGSAPQCISGVSLNESTSQLPSTGPDAAWRETRGNLQNYSIPIRGVDLGGYAALRTIKRAKTKITWTLQSDDSAINQTGTGYVVSLDRTHTPGDDIVWSANIEGYNEPTDV